MLCYRCGSHVPDGTEACGTCGQKFALGLKPGPIAGFGTGTRRHRIAVEPAPYRLGDVLAGRFRLRENVGAGPLGWIFKAVDLDLDVDVALKVVSPRLMQVAEERRALARELRLVQRLSHPNLVRVYEEGEDDERLFFTMQYLEGLSLRRIWDLRRQKGQVFSLDEVRPIVEQIAQALDAVHAVTSHGSLKPDNVLVLPDLVKVTDVGLANGLPRAPFMAAQRAGGVQRYLAPEFLHGERIDPRADVFALGVIAGEMLAGVPFEQPGLDLRARMPSLSPAVAEVVRRASSLDPAERFARAGDFAKALADAASGRPVVVPEPPAVDGGSTPVAIAGPAPTTAERDVTEEIEDDDFEELTPPPRIEVRAKSTAVPSSSKPGGSAAKPGSGDRTVALAEEPTRIQRTPSGSKRSTTDEESRAKDVPSKPDRMTPSVAEPAWTSVAPEAPGPAMPPAAPVPAEGTSSQRLPVVVAIVLLVAIALYLAFQPGADDPSKEALAQVLPPVPEEEVVATNEPASAGDLDAGTHAAPEQASAIPVPETKAASAPVAKRASESAKSDRDRRHVEELARQAEEQARQERAQAALAEQERLAKAMAEAERLAKERAAVRIEQERLVREQAAETDGVQPLSAERVEGAGTRGITVALKGGTTCPSGMRFIPAGRFKLGAPNSDPLKDTADLDSEDATTDAYCIDLYEAPNRRGIRPTAGVTWKQAADSCRASGKRLCSEEEWERACKGPGGSARFPYGREFDPNACNTTDAGGDVRTVAFSGVFSKCASGFNVFDLSGNVAEWTASPVEEGGSERVVKGGAADRPDFAVRCAAREARAPGTRDRNVGFRCCADPK